MVYCTKCGKKIDDDSMFCTKCGKNLSSKKDGATFEQNIEDFAQEIEKIGKQVGKKIEKTMKDLGSEDSEKQSQSKVKQVANQVEKNIDDFGKKFEFKEEKLHNWYDDTFGMFSPILSSFIGIIILSFIIVIFRFIGQEIQMFENLSSFFTKYLLYIFLFMIFSSYTSYFSRHYKKWFKWIMPITNALSFIVGFWFFIQILTIINQSINIGLIEWFLSISDILMPVIAFLILFIGYIALIVPMMSSEFISESKTKTSGKTKMSSKPEKSEKVDTKNLYRSGENKILAGICGGFSEYFKIDVTIIRVICVVAFLVTFGFIIIPYLIFWLIIPRNPDHKWS